MDIEGMRKELYEYCKTHSCDKCHLMSRERGCAVYKEIYQTRLMSKDEIERYYAEIHKCDTKPEPGADQSAKADAGKPDLTLVPLKIIWDIAKVREFGTQKYKDPDNWKRVKIERYRAAAFRHFLRYLDDPHGYDEESGLPHLAHLATNISFLCAMETYESRTTTEKTKARVTGDERCGTCEFYERSVSEPPCNSCYDHREYERRKDEV